MNTDTHEDFLGVFRMKAIREMKSLVNLIVTCIIVNSNNYLCCNWNQGSLNLSNVNVNFLGSP